jgi:ribosome-associated protein
MPDIAIEIARTIVETLEEKKGDDIVLLDLVDVCSFTDYFVICSGRSDRTLKALGDEVRKQVKQHHAIREVSVEGAAADGWVLIDYGDVILHLFSIELRQYYQLEGLWHEGKVLVRVQ